MALQLIQKSKKKEANKAPSHNPSPERTPGIKSEQGNILRSGVPIFLQAFSSASQTSYNEEAEIRTDSEGENDLSLSKAGCFPKLMIGAPDDPAEQEAEAFAQKIMQPGYLSTSCNTIDSCREKSSEQQLHRKPKTDSPKSPELPSAPDSPVGSGQVMDRSTRQYFEPRLGMDLSGVRLYTDPSAARSAQALNARAYTIGNDIVFGYSQYEPSTNKGRGLLAHELAHICQQKNSSQPLIRRFVDGEVRQMTITPEWAEQLTENELVEQISILRQSLSPDSSATYDEQTLRTNLTILENRQRSLIEQGHRPARAVVAGQVARPQGLPMNQGFLLQPIDLPPELLEQIPEGQLTDLTPQMLASEGNAPSHDLGRTMLQSGPGMAGGAASVLLNSARYLNTYGFEAAGPNAIGVVSFPRTSFSNVFRPGRPFIPQSRLAWGHTAIYSRVNGRITIIRSFAPRSLLGTLVTDIRTGGGVMSGAESVPGAWYHSGYTPGRGIPMFTPTTAYSVEYPVAQTLAESFAQSLPEIGPTPMNYTGNPAAYCRGQNCIAAAVRMAEDTLGGPVGPLVGPEGGPTSVIDIGRSGRVVPGEASQGRMLSWLRNTESGLAEAAPVANSTGEAVVGTMTRGMKVLRWGGRVFFVIGLATIPLEYALAPEEEGTRTLIGASAGFAGGLAFGAAAGLVCGPGAPVCSLVLGIGFGIAGGMATRSLAEGIYDVSTGRITPDLSQGGIVHPPSCHAMQREWERERQMGRLRLLAGSERSLMLPNEPLMGSARQVTLSDGERQRIIEWLSANEPGMDIPPSHAAPCSSCHDTPR